MREASAGPFLLVSPWSLCDLLHYLVYCETDACGQNHRCLHPPASSWLCQWEKLLTGDRKKDKMRMREVFLSSIFARPQWVDLVSLPGAQLHVAILFLHAPQWVFETVLSSCFLRITAPTTIRLWVLCSLFS